MKKVVLASLLACVAIASGLPSARAQQPVALGTGDAKAACPPMADPEYKSYTDAMAQTDPKAKAAAIEAYLTAFPQSCEKLNTLVYLMATYSAAGDAQKTLDTADRVLQLEPDNLQALYAEALIRKSNADSTTDAAGKQAALDAAAGYAQKGLAALAGPKPASLTDAQFSALKASATPSFYSVIATAAAGKKDYPTAIDNYKKELASVPVAQTQAPGPILQDTYFLALAYLNSTPPDLLDCTFYATRFTEFAPEPYKSQVAPTAKYCYTKFHGGTDGYDAVGPVVQANLNPPAGWQASIKPAPTPADYVNAAMASTPDLGTLAIADKEFILQNGTPDQAGKVWDTIKGKSVEIPGAVVIASTPAQLQVAVSDDAKQSKTADFTFNMAPPEDIPEGKTPAQKALYRKKKAEADKTAAAVAAATAVGQTVTLDGTYDSFTPKPIMITMSSGAVVLPKAAPAPVHHAPARR